MRTEPAGDPAKGAAALETGRGLSSAQFGRDDLLSL
jgi:hypothetical protein